MATRELVGHDDPPRPGEAGVVAVRLEDLDQPRALRDVVRRCLVAGWGVQGEQQRVDADPGRGPRVAQLARRRACLVEDQRPRASSPPCAICASARSARSSTRWTESGPSRSADGAQEQRPRPGCRSGRTRGARRCRAWSRRGGPSRGRRRRAGPARSGSGRPARGGSPRISSNSSSRPRSRLTRSAQDDEPLVHLRPRPLEQAAVRRVADHDVAEPVDLVLAAGGPGPVDELLAVQRPQVRRAPTAAARRAPAPRRPAAGTTAR